MIKDDKIEFRCSAAMKTWLLGRRSAVGARTLSQAARALFEDMMENAGATNLWSSVPALKEIALHLDRIAAAVQRRALDGDLPWNFHPAESRVLAEVTPCGAG